MSNQIIYSSEKVANAEGRTVKNPNHFVVPIEGVTKVYLNGNYPRIRKAYEAAGVSVSDVADMRAPPKAKPAEPKHEPKGEPAKTGD